MPNDQSQPAAEPWVVLSYEHDGWWGSKRCGYFRDLLQAGLYTEQEARAIESEANRGAVKHELAMSLTEAIALVTPLGGNAGRVASLLVLASVSAADNVPRRQEIA